MCARDPAFGGSGYVDMEIAGYSSSKQVRSGVGRFALPSGTQALTFTFNNGRVVSVETIIDIVPDTIVKLTVDLATADSVSRYVPPSQCAVIAGIVTAGGTGRAVSHATIYARGTQRDYVQSDAHGRYCLRVPAGHVRLLAWSEHRGAPYLDTIVSAGESVTVNIKMQFYLASSVLEAARDRLPQPDVRQPVRDATAADTDIVRAVEEWLELNAAEREDTATTRRFAAFELRGASASGSWLTAYGREHFAEYSAVGEQPVPNYDATWPCIALLLRTGGRLVAMEPWHESKGSNIYLDLEGQFPSKYRPGMWDTDSYLDDRLNAKAKAWRERTVELKSHRS